MMVQSGGAQQPRRERTPLDRALAGMSQVELADERIVERHLGAAIDQEPVDVDRRRLPGVIDVGLVGHAEEEDRRAVQALPPLVQRLHGLLHHVVRHGAVHLPGELDEAGLEPVLLRLPGQVEGIDRDAMSAEPGPG